MTTPRTAPAASSFDPSTSSVRGRFLWHELLAPAAEPAKPFYAEVAGWSATSMSAGPDLPSYDMFMNGERAVAGVMPFPAGAPAGAMPTAWLPYIGTDDVDATCAAAVARGARVQTPATDIPTVGRIAVLLDPFGAAFALYTPTPAGGVESAPKNGEFSWHDLVCSDPSAALEFYSALFGWAKTVSMDMGEDGAYHMFGRGRFTYGGIFRRGAVPVAAWNSFIQVPDLDRACDAVIDGGGSIVMAQHEVPGGDRIARVRDNQGASFSLHQKGKG
jgi:predicted enzyme related to lactoylglutathione lyase